MAAQAVELSETGNSRISMGGNMPPEMIVFNTIEAYYGEAKNWCSDGFAIVSQEQADEVDTLDKALLKTAQEAEALRIEEKRPLDEQVATIQAKFNPFIQKGSGKVDMARASLKALLTAWRVEQQRLKDIEAKRIRDEADAAELAAQQAFAQSNVADIEQREEAERMATRAADLAKLSKRTDKAATTNTGLRTSWVPRLTDRNAAIKHYWAKDPDAFERLAIDMAVTEVRQGARAIPGFEIIEVKGAI